MRLAKTEAKFAGEVGAAGGERAAEEVGRADGRAVFEPAHRRHFGPPSNLRTLLRLRQPVRMAGHPLWRHTPSKLRSCLHLLIDGIVFANNFAR